MVYSAADQFRGNRRSWDAIANRLSFAWDGRTRLDTYVAANPWNAFRDAGVMMEMADYAERHTQEFNSASLDSLRNTAFQLRLESFRAFLTRNPLE